MARPRVLQLLTGRAGSGKTARCLALFRERILESPDAGLRQPSYFILPNREHAGRIHALLLRDPRFKGVLNLHVTTINEFIRLKVKSGARTLSHFDRARLSSEILADGEWPWLGGARDTKGLAYALADFLREVKQSVTDTGAFQRESETLARNDPYYARKHADLSRFVERYDAACVEEGFRDPEDEVRAFADSVREGREKPVLDLVVFDGFFSFTGVQQLFVEAVAGRAARTIVTLTLDPRPGRADAFRFPLRTRERLLAAGFVEKRMAAKNFRFKSPGLARLENSIFCDGPPLIKAPSAGVTFIEAANAAREVEGIAREVRRLVREEGHHWSDIMVVLRDIGPRREAFERAFRELEVPCEVHERKRLSESPVIRFVIGWTSLWSARPDRWIAWLRSEFLGFDPRAIDEIESVLEPAAEGAFPGVYGGVKLTETAAAVLREARGRWDAYRASSDAAGFRRFFEQLLASHVAAEDEAGIREALRGVLEEIVTDAARAEFSLHRTNDRLASQLEHGLYSPPTPEKNRVQIYDVSLALQKEYRAVFVSGLEDGVFPRPPQSEPVLKSAEREHFNGAGMHFDTRAIRASGERFYFYMAATRASERLYLTRAAADADGRRIPASVFFKEARRALPGAGLLDAPREAVPASGAAVTPRDFVRIFAAAAGRGDSRVVESSAEVLRARPGTEDGRSALAARFRALKRPCVLKADDVLAELAAFSRPFSAHRIADLSNCGYKHFAGYLLSLRDDKLRKARVQDGKIRHAVLEKAYKKLFGPGSVGVPSADEIREAFRREFDEVFAAHPVDRERPHRREWRRSALMAELDDFANVEAERFVRRPGYRPEKFEWEFHFPMTIGSEMILLEGRIDRVDIDRIKSRALILDYKSSKEGLTHTGMAKGEHPQVPVYLWAVGQGLGVAAVGVELVPVKGEEKPSRFAVYLPDEKREPGGRGWHDPDEFNDALNEMKKGIGESVRKLKSGDIRALPGTCAYCDYRPLCRFEGRSPS